MYVLTPSSCPGVVVVEELSVWLLMEPTCFQCARARLAPARARFVASSLFSHSKSHPDRSLFCLYPAPLYPPPSCAFRPLSSDPFSPSPLILAPLGPRNKHTTTQGATPSARSLRGRHNRRRKLPFPRALRPTVWHRVSSSPATQGHL